jgi:solute carrier family 13 (sodium-dependent dicarboxylate transporter), member 2/3/5
LSEDIRPGGTYKTLDEQREVLSPAEERFEKYRRTIGLFPGLLALLVMLLLPLGLPYAQQSLAAVLVFVVVYWVTEAIPIPVTAVLGLALCVILNVPQIGTGAEDDPADVIFGSFADDTIFLFIGSFIIARAMIVHVLDKRFAYLVLSIPGMARSTYGVIIAFGLIALILIPLGISLMAPLVGLA